MEVPHRRRAREEVLVERVTAHDPARLGDVAGPRGEGVVARPDPHVDVACRDAGRPDELAVQPAVGGAVVGRHLVGREAARDAVAHDVRLAQHHATVADDVAVRDEPLEGDRAGAVTIEPGEGGEGPAAHLATARAEVRSREAQDVDRVRRGDGPRDDVDVELDEEVRAVVGDAELLRPPEARPPEARRIVAHLIGGDVGAGVEPAQVTIGEDPARPGRSEMDRVARARHVTVALFGPRDGEHDVELEGVVSHNGDLLVREAEARVLTIGRDAGERHGPHQDVPVRVVDRPDVGEVRHPGGRSHHPVAGAETDVTGEVDERDRPAVARDVDAPRVERLEPEAGRVAVGRGAAGHEHVAGRHGRGRHHHGRRVGVHRHRRRADRPPAVDGALPAPVRAAQGRRDRRAIGAAEGARAGVGPAVAGALGHRLRTGVRRRGGARRVGAAVEAGSRTEHREHETESGTRERHGPPHVKQRSCDGGTVNLFDLRAHNPCTPYSRFPAAHAFRALRTGRRTPIFHCCFASYQQDL